MPTYQVIVLALVQALTEFLPVSSTAHLTLIPWLFKWRDPGLVFDVALHVGTFLAVVLYFGRLWIRVILSGFGLGSPQALAAPASGSGLDRAGRTAGLPERPSDDSETDRRLFWLLALGTIPAMIAGLLLEKRIETTFRSPYVIAASMIVVAFVMAYGDRVSTRRRALKDVGAADTLAIGCAQAIALIPGVSRSGITMTAGLLRDFRRDTAARFSFLLATPVVAGAAVLKAHHVLKQGLPADMRLPFLLGILISALAGYAVIALFIRYLQTHTLKVFIYYRIVVGIIILALAIFSSAP